MLDLLIYCEIVKLLQDGQYVYQIVGKICFVGDIFGEVCFVQFLQVGLCISIVDVVGYIMVKKNWFNGVLMFVIVIWDENGMICEVCWFIYDDYKFSLF